MPVLLACLLHTRAAGHASEFNATVASCNLSPYWWPEEGEEGFKGSYPLNQAARRPRQGKATVPVPAACCRSMLQLHGLLPTIRLETAFPQAADTGSHRDGGSYRSKKWGEEPKRLVYRAKVTQTRELLLKKIDEISTDKAVPQQTENDIDFYAQHYERPINKPKMEALQHLIEHRTELTSPPEFQ